MPISEQLKQVGIDLQEIKENVVKLLERDKVQNKRLENHEEKIESLRTKIDNHNNFVNKVLGAFTIIAFIMPIVLKFIK